MIRVSFFLYGSTDSCAELRTDAKTVIHNTSARLYKPNVRLIKSVAVADRSFEVLIKPYHGGGVCGPLGNLDPELYIGPASTLTRSYLTDDSILRSRARPPVPLSAYRIIRIWHIS